jgi:hypothetical protein
VQLHEFLHPLELVAEKLGITAMRKILNAGVQFLYRTYTTEGQLKHGVPAATAAMKDVMKLRNLLEKEGIDVAGMDEALAENGEQLVRNIGKLVGVKQRIKIDDTVYVRTDSGETTALPYTQQPKLGYDKDPT